MMTWKRPLDEVQDALEAQISFLRSSARAYDQGHSLEALRLANAVFIIVHDGGQRSSLTQLGKRGGLRVPIGAGDHTGEPRG